MGVTMIEIKSLLHNMSLIGSILKSDFGDFSTFSFSFILIFTIPIQKWAAKLAGHYQTPTKPGQEKLPCSTSCTL